MATSGLSLVDLMRRKGIVYVVLAGLQKYPNIIYSHPDPVVFLKQYEHGELLFLQYTQKLRSDQQDVLDNP